MLNRTLPQPNVEPFRLLRDTQVKIAQKLIDPKPSIAALTTAASFACPGAELSSFLDLAFTTGFKPFVDI